MKNKSLKMKSHVLILSDRRSEWVGLTFNLIAVLCSGSLANDDVLHQVIKKGRRTCD